MEKVGPYLIIGRLATGGMAEVFLARRDGPAGFEKIQVVKRILPQFAEDPEFRRMFLDEARLAALLNHPNVVQIFELGGTRDALYIAMEYVPGFDLARVMDASLKARRLIPSPVSARIVADAAAGLDFAHRLTDAKGQPRGIVHRDISPENLLVSELGTVKVVDFGIARANTGHQLSASGRLKGKVHYHAPEHIQGKPVDGKGDVYALGVVLYELVCARRPFEGEGELEVMRKTVEQDPPHPSKWYPAADPDLSDIALRSLARDQSQRPTAGELRNELELYLRKHPCTAADIERYLLEVIPADAQDRTKARKLLEMAPVRQITTSDPGHLPAPGSQPRPADDKTVRDQRVRRALLPLGAGLLLGVGSVTWFMSRPGPAPAPAPAPQVIAVPTPPPANEVAVPPTPAPVTPPKPTPAVEKERELHVQRAAGHRPAAFERATPNAVLVTVHVSPRCQLFVDKESNDRPLGRDFPLSPGTHTFHFVNAKMHLNAFRTVQIDPGERAERRFSFEEKPVKVAVSPWAYLTVDDKEYGPTPVMNLKLYEGTHKVALKDGKGNVASLPLSVTEESEPVIHYSFNK